MSHTLIYLSCKLHFLYATQITHTYTTLLYIHVGNLSTTPKRRFRRRGRADDLHSRSQGHQ